MSKSNIKAYALSISVPVSKSSVVPGNPTTPTRALEDTITAAKSSYTSRNLTSQSLNQHALEFVPGGNTRSVSHNDPFPLCMTRGSGDHLWGRDGHAYIDFGELTAGLYGHSNPLIRKAMIETFDFCRR